MQDRETALKEQENAREWQAIAYGDHPATWAALAYYRERGWPVDANTFPERDRCENRIFAFKAGYAAALASPLSAPPQEPTGASPQAETSAGQVRQCDAIHLETGAACELPMDHDENHCGAFRGGVAQWPYPAPVSPVEPTPPTLECCACGHLNTPQQATRLEGEWRSSGEYVCLDSDACARRIAECSEPPVEPTPEPETCEWRYSADAEWWQSGCDSQDLSGDERLVGPDEKAKFCPYCGKPLRLVPSEETK